MSFQLCEQKQLSAVEKGRRKVLKAAIEKGEKRKQTNIQIAALVPRAILFSVNSINAIILYLRYADDVGCRIAQSSPRNTRLLRVLSLVKISGRPLCRVRLTFAAGDENDRSRAHNTLTFRLLARQEHQAPIDSAREPLTSC